MQPDTDISRPGDQEVAAISRGKLIKSRTISNTKSKKQKRGRRHQARAPPDDPDAYSINEFCHRHMISRGTYNRLRAEGRGPAEIKLRQRVLISREAAAAWRQRMEAETAAARTAAE
jgi:hypothetical protein